MGATAYIECSSKTQQVADEDSLLLQQAQAALVVYLLTGVHLCLRLCAEHQGFVRRGDQGGPPAPEAEEEEEEVTERLRHLVMETVLLASKGHHHRRRLLASMLLLLLYNLG